MNEGELKQRISLPLEAKIIITENRIDQWHMIFGGDVYISFSGGLDSTVLANIVRKKYPDVPLVFSNTGLEYPEIIKFVRKQNNVVWVRPSMSYKEVVETHGFPVISKQQSHFIAQYKRNPNSENCRRMISGIMPNGRETAFVIAKKWRYLLDEDIKISDYCCEIMKKQPLKRYEKETGRAAIIGITYGESSIRNMDYLKHGCNSFTKNDPKSQPLAFWTKQDILKYVYDNQIEISEIYGKVVKYEDFYTTTKEDRTGCMFCGFGVHLENEPNRFQRMKITHPKLHKVCMENIGMKKVLDLMNVKTE